VDGSLEMEISLELSLHTNAWMPLGFAVPLVLK